MQYNYFKTECVSKDLTKHINKVGEELAGEAKFLIDCYGICYSFTVLVYDDGEDIWTDGYIDLHGHFIQMLNEDGNVFDNEKKTEDFVNRCNDYLRSNEGFLLVIASMLKGR